MKLLLMMVLMTIPMKTTTSMMTMNAAANRGYMFLDTGYQKLEFYGHPTVAKESRADRTPARI
jgi:hypothetical protein